MTVIIAVLVYVCLWYGVCDTFITTVYLMLHTGTGKGRKNQEGQINHIKRGGVGGGTQRIKMKNRDYTEYFKKTVISSLVMCT